MHDDRNASIQWTAGAKFRGNQRSKGRVLTEHVHDWKRLQKLRKEILRDSDCGTVMQIIIG